MTVGAVLLLALPQAASAALSWSGPIALEPGAGLSGVACPSPSQCTAVGSFSSQAVTFDPTSLGVGAAGSSTPLGADPVVGIACPSVSQCTAVDDGDFEMTFDPASPGTPAQVFLGDLGPDPPVGVVCPTVSQCTAIGDTEVTFDPNAPGTPTWAYIGEVGAASAVACPSTAQCTVVDSGGQEVTFDPDAPGSAMQTTIDDGAPLYGVACPSVTQCTAVSRYGAVVTFDPNSPGTPTLSSGGGDLWAVACPSVSQCTAVGGAGEEYDEDLEMTFAPASPVSSTSTVLAHSGGLEAVACSSVALCVAVDTGGNVFVGVVSPCGTSTLKRLTCAAKKLKGVVACGVEIAAFGPLKALKGIKIIKGFYNTGKFGEALEPVYKLYNDVMRLRFRNGVNGAELWKRLQKGRSISDLVKDVADYIALGTDPNGKNFKEFAKDFADLVGVGDCVDLALGES